MSDRPYLDAERENPDWNVQQAILFHFYNPAGLWQQQEDLNRRLRENIQRGTVPTDWLLAYDGSHHICLLRDMLTAGLSRQRYETVRDIWANQIARAYEMLNAKVLEAPNDHV